MRKTKKVFRKILTVIIIFLFVFAASFVGFGYLVNKYTPEIDVQIGDTTKSFFDENKISSIDEHLKEIQNEDNGITEEDKKEEAKAAKEEKEEEEVKPQKPEKEEKKVEEEEKPKNESAPKSEAPIPKKSEIANQAMSDAPITKTKVFAGYYTTLEEAVTAQNKLDELMPDVSPFIKEMNGSYVVQIGVYSNPNSAEDMYNKVKSMNFPAKMKSE